MTVGTWNVNGIRARQAQVLDWIARDRPDVVCLQEIKAAPSQLPPLLFEPEGYWCYWHGAGGYSGVALLVSRACCPSRPLFQHPAFDHETRVVTAEVGEATIASIYVPNGGKDYGAKLQFLRSLAAYADDARKAGRLLVLCGDMNVTRTDQDVHPKERKAEAIGQRADERGLFERVIAQGLVDVGRTLDPENDALFTWWAPWRNLRQRNIGWRLDYVLASEGLAARAESCRVLADYGTSDHAPVVAEFRD